jgi:hypothetical protein
MLPDSRKSIVVWKVPRRCPFLLLIRATCRWRRVWSTGGMILTEENRRTCRNACPNATLPTINLTCTGLDSNTDLRGDTPAIGHVSHGTVIESYFIFCASRFPKVTAFWKLPSLPRFVILVRAACRWCWALVKAEGRGEKPPPVPCVHQKFDMEWTGIKLGTPLWEAND